MKKFLQLITGPYWFIPWICLHIIGLVISILTGTWLLYFIGAVVGCIAGPIGTLGLAWVFMVAHLLYLYVGVHV